MWLRDSTLVLPIVILVEADSVFLSWCLVSNIINLVLSSFSLSMFAAIQLQISAIHPSSCSMHHSLAPALDGLKARYSC